MGLCLAFPYFDADGNPMEFTNGDGTAHPFVRLKPDKPRPDRKAKEKGKKIKYESPVRAPCRAYIPRGTWAILSDPSVPLVITEGEKKALCADQHGIPCIGLGGIWSWQRGRPTDADGNKTGPRELIPDLEAVAWAGRAVTIVPDSDLGEKSGVQWATWHFAEVLREKGAKVLVAVLPSEADG